MATASRDVSPGKIWAFTDHRTQAQIVPPAKFIEARVIEAKQILWDHTASPSLRKLAAIVVGRWGAQ